MRYFTVSKEKIEDEKMQDSSKQAPKEKAFDYSKMDYYQILEIFPSASEADIKKSYLKLAKKYHPDVYHSGPNKDHFKKIQEAYTTLKNPVKRGDYDKHQKIKTMKYNKDFQDAERRHKNMGQEFSHEMYEEMKKQAEAQKTVRDTIDPEFDEAFKKLNLNKLYKEFVARPILNQPDELHDQIMKPLSRLKMSRRDLARIKFVSEYRDKQKIKKSIKNRIIEQTEIFKDIEEGAEVFAQKNMNYKQLVEEMNKDIKALESIERPLTLYKDEKAMIAEIRKKQDESLDKVKKVVYPFWTIAIIVNGILLIGYYNQDKIHEVDEKKMELRQKFDKYRYA
ncbi:cytochrome c biogenesis protein [Stylonychia lemnae]|uniref:Cytochrome c biogenesis protein n=1 Tax=Stylonychia lemnae TaxID=5949 RepID=A0A077ZZ14_STYLE|nr:cytochrome c biogenesis protein [Stylonychia lemnae]|eukprot:CDW75160.1 cytochrome c biogenesis protein [Stylonychia lemnae]